MGDNLPKFDVSLWITHVAPCIEQLFGGMVQLGVDRHREICRLQEVFVSAQRLAPASRAYLLSVGIAQPQTSGDVHTH